MHSENLDKGHATVESILPQTAIQSRVGPVPATDLVDSYLSIPQNPAYSSWLIGPQDCQHNFDNRSNCNQSYPKQAANTHSGCILLPLRTLKGKFETSSKQKITLFFCPLYLIGPTPAIAQVPPPGPVGPTGPSGRSGRLPSLSSAALPASSAAKSRRWPKAWHGTTSAKPRCLKGSGRNRSPVKPREHITNTYTKANGKSWTIICWCERCRE